MFTTSRAEELADQGFRRNQDFVRAAFSDAFRFQGGDLLAGFGDDLLRFRVDEIVFRFHAAPGVGTEAGDPAFLVEAEDRAGVEAVEDLFGVVAERIQDRRRRQLALAVDPDVQDVLRVELEVEPRAAVRDDAGGEQQLAGGVGLALVMVEEDARRAVHLRDDHALGAVDDERTLVGHQRDVAEIAFLLFHFLDGACAGFFVDVEHDELEAHLERRLVGQVALHALFNVELRLFEFVGNVFERCALGEVGDRENRFEDTAETIIRALFARRVHLEEGFVGLALDLDQVWHFDGFGNAAEVFADTFLFREGECHPKFPFFRRRQERRHATV
jgi:hypothetical protein